MTKYLPSWRGLLGVGVAVFGGFVLPALTSARSVRSGWLLGSAPILVWVIAAVIVTLSITFGLLAWKQAQRADRIAAIAAFSLTVFLVLRFLHAVS